MVNSWELLDAHFTSQATRMQYVPMMVRNLNNILIPENVYFCLSFRYDVKPLLDPDGL